MFAVLPPLLATPVASVLAGPLSALPRARVGQRDFLAHKSTVATFFAARPSRRRAGRTPSEIAARWLLDRCLLKVRAEPPDIRRCMDRLDRDEPIEAIGIAPGENRLQARK